MTERDNEIQKKTSRQRQRDNKINRDVGIYIDINRYRNMDGDTDRKRDIDKTEAQTQR